MAKNHFALERPRKITISIPGYDADAATRLQGRIQSDQRKRKKKGENQKQQPVQAASPPPETSPDEVRALNESLRTPKREANDLVQIFSGAPDGGAE